MNLIKPKKLKIGDTIGIIAPSGNVDFTRILQSVKYFEQKGFNVRLGKNISSNLYDYLAGSDSERLEDLHNAFLDDEIDAILCARGGYGALRLINRIDYSLIRDNPKIFCGYSDITVLSTMFYKKCGLITFSGPMSQGDFSTKIDSFTEKSFYATLQNNEFHISSKLSNPKIFSVEGVLFGGNLATIVSLCGIDFIPDEKFIFFVEDIGEPVYKLDRYFTQLFNIEKFRANVVAIICGDFTELDSKINFDNLMPAISTNYACPVVKGFSFGHESTKATIPVGAWATLKNDGLYASSYLLDN